MEQLASNMMNDIITNATKSVGLNGVKDSEVLNEDKGFITEDYMNKVKKQYDLLLQDLNDRLSHEEDAHTSLTQAKKKLESELASQKKEIEDLELSLQKVSQSSLLIIN